MSGRTAVAMSGGLDSSVAAWLLSKSGEAMAGLSMLLWNEPNRDRRGRCCGALDLLDARRIADQCGLPHYTLSLEDSFRQKVVDPFVDEYLAGRTPNPCTRCNTWVKFDLLLDRAREIGAERLATGHYARILEGPNGLELHRATCPEKDQSYYLFELSQRQLRSIVFPLGEMSKEKVRAVAREAGLTVADKGESMDVCFVAGSVQEFVERRLCEEPQRVRAVAADGASVVDTAGRELGRAGPYYRYTVGQRRGLGVGGGKRLYVLEVDAEANRLVVGGNSELASRGLEGTGLHWIEVPPREPIEAEVKIRSRHAGIRSRIEPRAEGGVAVEFTAPQRGVAPGQAAVFYEGTRVLGGCWIERALPAREG